MEQIVRKSKRGVVLAVHVTPRSARNEIVGVHGTALKVRVSASPVKGRANRALVELLAATLAIPKGQIEVIAGLRSRDKVMAISGLSREMIAAVLQKSLSERGKPANHQGAG